MSESAAAKSSDYDSVWSELDIEQANHILHIHRDILGRVAKNDDFQVTLDSLSLATEALLPNSVASIMLFNDSRTALMVESAPSMDPKAINVLNGLVPGPAAGSCGTAVYSDEPQFVEDTSLDARWANFGQYVVDFKVRACWSYPILTAEGKAIGSVALSSFEKRQPLPFHRRLLETAAHLACVILERKLEQDRLWRLAHHDPLTSVVY